MSTEPWTKEDEILAELEAMNNREHEHSFTIPVEWEYFRRDADGSVSPIIQSYTPAIKRVTKLMCTCGEEKSR